MSSLHEKVLTRWSKSKVSFDYRRALELVNQGPASMSAKDMLDWATSHPFLKLRRTLVPDGILPCEAHIIDISIRPPKRRGRGPRILDDDVYDAFPPLRKYVARGLCVLETKDGARGACQYQIVISAMKKFTGGPGDDDDLAEFSDEDDGADTNTLRARWQHYFTESSDHAVRLIDSSKENGDSAHMGVARVGGAIFPVLGSKLVHIIVGTADHVELYPEAEFRHAKGLARAFFETQVSGRVGEAKFREFLATMSAKHYTATFEYLDVGHQHVELFAFPRSTFRFIAFTSTSDVSLLCCDIEAGVEMAAEAGFETMKITAHDAKDQDALFQSIRQTHGTEGSVVYYLNADNKVIGMVKKKSVWYILVRAFREKMKGLRSRVVRAVESNHLDGLEKATADVKRSVRKMLRQKQEWLGFSERVKAAWEELGMRLCDWLVAQLRQRKLEPSEVGDMWPLVWNRFLRECKQSDVISLDGEAL